MFIEAGSHAREWIGPATATWMINRLIEKIDGNGKRMQLPPEFPKVIRDLSRYPHPDTLGETIRSVDWYVLPVLNPDGYEYSHVYDRFWRKTRSKHADGNGSMFSVA